VAGSERAGRGVFSAVDRGTVGQCASAAAARARSREPSNKLLQPTFDAALRPLPQPQGRVKCG
jgi:hypothetical protein